MFLKHSQATKRSYRDDLGRARTLARYFAGRDMWTLRAADVYGYIEQRRVAGVSNGTINRELMLLSAAIGHVRLTQEIELPNPVRGRMLPESQGRVRWLTQDEAQRLIASADPCLADFIRLALHTGCRAGELINLQWSRVDFDRAAMLLEPQHTKTARRRSVPLNLQAVTALQSRLAWRDRYCPETNYVFLNDRCSPRRTFQKGFQEACRAAGIDNFRIHDLRHTCAAWLVNTGVPLIVVRDLLGHASVQTTEIYAHLSPENVRQALTLIEGGSM